MTNSLADIVVSIAEAPDGTRLEVDVAHLLTFIKDRAKEVLATKHPLGFIHAELTPLVPDLPQDTRVRLHVWRDSFTKADELGFVHDHTWRLKSYVLIGTLIDITLEPIASVEGEYVGFRVGYGEANEFNLEGRWHLNERERRRISTGYVYSLSPRTVHRTEVSIPPLATLLVTVDESEGGPGPIVYSHRAGSRGTSIRPRVPVDTLSGILQYLVTQASPRG